MQVKSLRHNHDPMIVMGKFVAVPSNLDDSDLQVLQKTKADGARANTIRNLATTLLAKKYEEGTFQV